MRHHTLALAAALAAEDDGALSWLLRHLVRDSRAERSRRGRKPSLLWC